MVNEGVKSAATSEVANSRIWAAAASWNFFGKRILARFMLTSTYSMCPAGATCTKGCHLAVRWERPERRTTTTAETVLKRGGAYAAAACDTSVAGQGRGVSHARPAILQSQVPLLRVYEAGDLDEGIAKRTRVSRRDLEFSARARAVTSFDFSHRINGSSVYARTISPGFYEGHGPVVGRRFYSHNGATRNSCLYFSSYHTANLTGTRARRSPENLIVVMCATKRRFNEI